MDAQHLHNWRKGNSPRFIFHHQNFLSYGHHFEGRRRYATFSKRIGWVFRMPVSLTT
ncbi:MAG: hypothetical protein AAF960_11360 [Bacteroidota bacterium]